MKITIDVQEDTGLALEGYASNGRCEKHGLEYYSTLPDHSFFVMLDSCGYIIQASDIIEAIVTEHTRSKS